MERAKPAMRSLLLGRGKLHSALAGVFHVRSHNLLIPVASNFTDAPPPVFLVAIEADHPTPRARELNHYRESTVIDLHGPLSVREVTAAHSTDFALPGFPTFYHREVRRVQDALHDDRFRVAVGEHPELIAQPEVLADVIQLDDYGLDKDTLGTINRLFDVLNGSTFYVRSRAHFNAFVPVLVTGVGGRRRGSGGGRKDDGTVAVDNPDQGGNEGEEDPPISYGAGEVDVAG